MKQSTDEKRDRVRRRVQNAHSVPPNSEFFPEKKPVGYYDNDVAMRVAIYVRVSTDDPRQTTSYELQKKYYEEFVLAHPLWTLVEIYADEGISGTSLKHRDAFNRMIEDCKDGTIDLIITKSVSRFARNVCDFLGTIHMLADHNPPIGVFFETENLMSLNSDTSMGLSFQATMAEEESRNKSRSMEKSLRMRLDHGLPLTPELLGFKHDEDGKLIIDPETANIPKLMFYMYLYGYSAPQIADALTYLGMKTYLGNTKWTSSSVIQTMHNERYCGDVFTRKTFTRDVLSHKSAKNRGERPRTLYHDEHEGIISRDDYIAVQHMINNAKYRNKSILPELRVIKEGLLKGFVVVNPRWGGFDGTMYENISAEAYANGDSTDSQSQLFSKPGDFDFRKYALVPLNLISNTSTPKVTLSSDTIIFNKACIQKMDIPETKVEILIHPAFKMLVVRAASADSRNSVVWSKKSMSGLDVKSIHGAAFLPTIFSVFGWRTDYKYRMYGTLLENAGNRIFLFRAKSADALIPLGDVQTESKLNPSNGDLTPIKKSGQHAIGLPVNLINSFGNDYYSEQSFATVTAQSLPDWQLRMEGQLGNVGMKLNVTDFETLRTFIHNQLGDWTPEEA